MTLQEALKNGTHTLEDAQIEDATTDAWYLLEMVSKIDKNYYYMHMTEEMNEEQYNDYQRLIEKRTEHIPLQYITGEQEFMGCVFKVNSSVLIPRMETEILVSEVAKVLDEGMSVLDMCTGSGCIIISLMKYVKGLTGYACDISKQALKVARENARLNDVQIIFKQSDLFHNITEKFDVIVSNPPYIPTEDIDGLMTEVKSFEPVLALDGGRDGYDFYRQIITDSVEHLNAGGYLAFEVGYDQGATVAAMMKECGFCQIHQIKDLQQLDRVVIGKFKD